MYKWYKHIILLALVICSILHIQGQEDETISRSFDIDLKEKYNGRAFNYKTEELQEDEKKELKESIEKLDNWDLSWLGKAFVALLILFLAFVIIKAFYGSSLTFNKKIKDSRAKEIDLVEEEEIDLEQDFDKKICLAIDSNDYRLATRYYYLQTLKRLSKKKFIQFHIEKTNMDYQFEINNTTIRSDFKSLSKLYDYIWYGKFPINELDFKKIQAKFDHFAKQIA